MSFAAQLLELRLRRCLSQEELAVTSGLSVRTIGNLERGATSPQRRTVRALADGLGLDAAQLASFEEAAREAVAAADRAAIAGSVNLPAAVTSIIGRDQEIATVSRLALRDSRRLVTVIGPGGVGKSRLALEVAWRLADRFERAEAIDLSALRDRDDALAALASAVQVPPTTPATVASVATQVGNTAWLLLLDSLEHVPEVADDLARLAELCPRLRIIGTTRARLDGGVPLTPLPSTHAVRLLVERARAVRPGFKLTADNEATLASLCRRLDGLPLAIELAAGHLRSREPAEIEQELAVRATALAADVIDLPERHRTLRNTVEWSTDRLSESDRLRFAALGAFRGTVPLSAWEAVLRGAELPVDGLAESLTRLAMTSLVGTTRRGPDPGVVMLDTIREAAEDLLADSGLERRCRRAHAYHMFNLIRSADPAGIEANLDNVRTAVAFALAHDPTALDLAVVEGLAEHLTTRGRYGEVRRVLSAVAATIPDGAIRRRALLRAGVAANLNGDARSALELAAQATREADAADDVDLRISSLNLTGAAHKALGELDAAYQAYQSCLEAAIGAGNARYTTVALNNLGTVAHDRGAYAEALAHYERSLDLKRQRGDSRAIATALANVGGLRKDLGDHAAARVDLDAAVALFRAYPDPYGLAFSLALLAEAELGAGDEDAAVRSAREAVAISVEIDHAQTRAMAESALGDVDRLSGRPEAAEAHYVVALRHVVEPADRVRILERLAAMRHHRDADGAASLLAQADQIRQARNYAVPPVDRALTEANRRRIGLHGDTDTDRDSGRGWRPK